MNNNGKIKELKPSCLISDKNNTSYFGFDDTKICIISQGFEYLNNVDYIVETISNKTFTVRATYQNTKIVCVGFLSYYILYKNCTDIPLSTIANNYYNTSLNEYSKDKMDINKAKDEYPTIHLSQEKVFFEYAQKNFFPLLPECDITSLSELANLYLNFINTKQISKQTDEINTTNKNHSSNNKSYEYNISIISKIYEYLTEKDIDEGVFPLSSFCECIENADFKKLFSLPKMKNKTRYIIGFINKFINSRDKTKDWYLISARSISSEKLKCGTGANVSERWKNKLKKIKPHNI